MQRVVRNATTWLGIFLELNADGPDMLVVSGPDMELVLNARAQACLDAFWRPREIHSMTSWCLGRSQHCPVSCRCKGRSLNFPETQWSKVEDGQQSRHVTTCMTARQCLTKTSTERTTESRRHSTSIRGRLLWFGRSPAIPATDRRCWGGTVPACNRLSGSILLLFCSL